MATEGLVIFSTRNRDRPPLAERWAVWHYRLNLNAGAAGRDGKCSVAGGRNMVGVSLLYNQYHTFFPVLLFCQNFAQEWPLFVLTAL